MAGGMQQSRKKNISAPSPDDELSSVEYEGYQAESYYGESEAKYEVT